MGGVGVLGMTIAMLDNGGDSERSYGFHNMLTVRAKETLEFHMKKRAMGIM